MQNTSRRDLLAGIAALPAAFSQKLLGLFQTAPTAVVEDPAGAAPGRLRITPPSQSVVRRG